MLDPQPSDKSLGYCRMSLRDDSAMKRYKVGGKQSTNGEIAMSSREILSMDGIEIVGRNLEFFQRKR